MPAKGKTGDKTPCTGWYVSVSSQFLTRDCAAKGCFSSLPDDNQQSPPGLPRSGDLSQSAVRPR